MKKVSVVILNWNGRKLLDTFLPSVIAYTPNDIADIVVADNGSTDDSLDMLREQYPTVKRIVLNRNYGFAEGYNQALREIDTPYTVLLNSDVEVTPDWLSLPLKALEADEGLAGVQPKILAQKNKVVFEYAGAAGGWMDRYGYPFCRGRILHVIEEDHGQYEDVTEVFWVSGACFFIRTDVFKKEGGFDANFFAHQEEIDLCWRLRARGYRLCCIPQSVVFHVGGATLSVESPRKTYLNFRNNLLMLYKNLSEKEIKRTLLYRFFLDYLAALNFMAGRHVNNALAIYRARKEFNKLKKAYTGIRKENLDKTVNEDIPQMLRKSLIVCFYLKGKKRFDQLIQR